MTRVLTRPGETLRSRWFSIGLHVALWLLFLLAISGSGFGGHTPQFSESPSNPATVTTPIPVTRLQSLFAPANATKRATATNNLDLFATTYFVPRVQPTPPPTTPAPPPPTTWKTELTYQGFYQTGNGPKYALVRVADKLVSTPVGGSLVTNLFVVDAALKTLTLTNSAAQTNVLALNAKQVVEVPLK